MRLLLTGLMAGLIAFAPEARAAGNEELTRQLLKEQERLQKEKDPVDRAKIEIKISDILLETIGDSARNGDFTEMELHVAEYTKTIESAHETLVESGRDAQKKPGGFKDLEIALRKHVRRIEDLARTLNLDRRIPLEKAKDLAGLIRNRLLKALFP